MTLATIPSPASLSKGDRERVRANSKILLGNKDRLEVGVAIALKEDAAVNATDLADQLSLVNSRVRTQLLAFAKVNLLVEMPGGGELKRWYMRQDNPFWQSCLDLYLEWIP